MMVNGRLLLGVLFMVCFYQVHVYGETKTSSSRDKSLYFKSLFDVIGEDNREAKSSDNNLVDESFKSNNLPNPNLNYQAAVPPWYNNLMNQLVRDFKPQRQNTQFGFLYLDNIDDNVNTVVPHFYPNISGLPILNNRTTISPPENQAINYMAAVPGNARRGHVESNLCPRLHTFWSKYHTTFGKKPNVLLLYTWFFPCTNCTNDIIYWLSHQWYEGVAHKILSYSKATSPYIPYLTPENNRRNQLRLEAAHITVVHYDVRSTGDHDSDSY